MTGVLHSLVYLKKKNTVWTKRTTVWEDNWKNGYILLVTHTYMYKRNPAVKFIIITKVTEIHILEEIVLM
jgi:hypothetical protein